MDIFRKLQFKIKKEYIGFLCKFMKKEASYGNVMKNNKMTNCCTLNLTAETEKKKSAINAKLKKLVLKYINNPEKLVQYMKFNGLAVYNIKNAEKLLKYVNEEEGFILPSNGIEALVLNFAAGLFSEKKLIISFNSSPMFIFDEKNAEIYTIARALHKYFGFKNKLPGFDIKSQNLFKKVYNSRKKSSAPFSKSSLAEMYACKEAIQRDLESINFSIKLSEETEGAKHALQKIKETNSAKV